MLIMLIYKSNVGKQIKNKGGILLNVDTLTIDSIVADAKDRGIQYT